MTRPEYVLHNPNLRKSSYSGLRILRCACWSILLLLLTLTSLSVVSAQSNYATPYNFTTLAGSGIAGSINGTGAAAGFNRPYGVAVDTIGNVFVADFFGHKIRKVTPAGVVTTLAGSGVAGSIDGTGAAAGFNRPAGVAVDSFGNVFVADFGGHKIRKVTPAGVVTTLAGSGIAGSTNGTGATASFASPAGVAVDSSGNVYVGDTYPYENRIRKVTPAGVVTTLAGAGSEGSTDGTGTAASFNAPRCLAVDSIGNVFVADAGGHQIRKVTPAGVVTTLAGSGGAGSTDGTGAAASFNAPSGVAVDSTGNVFVTESGSHRIRKVTPAGVVTTLAGSGIVGSTNGTGAAAEFNAPIGVAVDISGNVYVADSSNHMIRKGIAALEQTISFSIIGTKKYGTNGNSVGEWL